MLAEKRLAAAARKPTCRPSEFKVRESVGRVMSVRVPLRKFWCIAARSSAQLALVIFTRWETGVNTVLRRYLGLSWPQQFSAVS